MENLFSSLQIRSLNLKNRLVMSPMCQYSAIDGFANDWHLVHLGGRAVGGAALVFTEATAISPQGRISPGDLGIWKDEHISMLKRITTFIRDQGAVAGMQLAHAGRKASFTAPWQGSKPLTPSEGAWQSVAPSALAFKPQEAVPLELTLAEIAAIVADFRSAARRALEAGFQILELHAAHGYLIHEFLSPLSNIRKDQYGGTFENRIRLLLEIIQAVRSVWPENLPLFIRISATEWVEGGWTEADSLRLAAVVKEKDIDLVDCSTGGNVPQVKIPLKPLYQVGFAESIKKATGILTGAVGLITTAEEADGIISQGRADLVFLGREFLRDPGFPLRAADILKAPVTWPVQYERAKRKH